MHVAYVINSLEGGGASAPVPSVVRVLQSQGCTVRILALSPRDLRGLPAIKDARIDVSVRDGGSSDHFAALRWLDERISQDPPDLIWTSLTRATLLGQIVGQMRHIDVVSWQHAAYLKPINRWLLKARRERSSFWLADSANVAALTQERLGIPPDHIAVWPLFSADSKAPQAAPWRPGDPIRIGSLGRLHPVKGYDILIGALARLYHAGFTSPAPLEIVVAGDGVLRAQLIAQAEQAGLTNLHFIGFTEPRAFLASLHLYVQPSRSEGLCIAAHEAMQAGLPVIASAVGELPYSIGEGVTGKIVAPADPQALAGALAEILAAPDQLAVLGRRARDRILQKFGGEAFDRAGAAALDRIVTLRALRSRDADRSAIPDLIDLSV